MSKTVLADVEGFTPVIDELADKYGLVRAAVFGRIWRFCQMEDGVCHASLKTIGDFIGIDRATVMRHAQALEKDGYLEDTTPGKRNAPHVYKDTGKAGIRINITVAQNNSLSKTVAESHTTVAQRNATVAESQLKRVLKKESKKEINTASQTDAAPPVSKPKSNTANLYAIATALASVCSIDFEANKERLFKESKLLCRATSPAPTPELILDNYNGHGYWTEQDWRGQKGQRPNLGDVRATWGKWSGNKSQSQKVSLPRL